MTWTTDEEEELRVSEAFHIASFAQTQLHQSLVSGPQVAALRIEFTTTASELRRILSLKRTEKKKTKDMRQRQRQTVELLANASKDPSAVAIRWSSMADPLARTDMSCSGNVQSTSDSSGDLSETLTH